MGNIKDQLAKIVSSEFVSDHAEEQYLYARDPGTMPPAKPDYVVMPGTTEEVAAVVKLANQNRIPVVPMGAGLVLSGLTRALKGGIILDMKRMNRILKVNEICRYVLVEAGTSQGTLQAYLKKHHPALKHSIPDAPPGATIGGNVLIHGSGHLSHMAGYHSDMLNGLEVVLPNGDITRIGSCALSSDWFARAPLPDLAGLFIGWAGTTGIVTRLAIKLYPRYKLNDVLVFVTDQPDTVPDILYRLSGVQVAEDITAWMMPKPAWAAGFQHINILFSANTKEELIWKRNLIRASVKPYIDRREAGFMAVPPPMKPRFLKAPSPDLARFADLKKGGGFEYVGGIMPPDRFPEAYRTGVEIAEKYQAAYSLGARMIGVNHSMMFFYAYAFNRADSADVERAQLALEETNQKTIEMGGIPWKAEEPAQKQIIQKMDPNMFSLMNRIRGLLDPNGIMNPGNWEVN
ncbi:MAG: FAD-binding oxidoreductase [Deltaproteobacteria bacterium]|nr:MAG: FAD-binding oxidoreductase [Deltaproteobacteria bacterium]